MLLACIAYVLVRLLSNVLSYRGGGISCITELSVHTWGGGFGAVALSPPE